MCFCLLYRIFNSPVGRWLHFRELAKCKANGTHPHVIWTNNDQAPVYNIGDLTVLPVPYLNDNLAYIVFNKDNNLIFLIDPGDFQMIQEVVKEYGLVGRPLAIFTTHKHHDHAGSNQLFADYWPGIRIVGGS